MFEVAFTGAVCGSARSGETEAEPASEATRRAKVRRERVFLKTESS
jgi:hypothetical protein